LSSSTSSFRRELKVVAVLLLLLAGMEAFFRLAGKRFSAELRRIEAIGVQAGRMFQQEGVRTLILGNSLTIDGIDRSLVLSGMESASGRRQVLEVLALNGTASCDWHRLLRVYFLDVGRRPHVLVINGRVGHFRDLEYRRPDRMAAYCPPSSWPEVLRDDLRTFGQRAEFIHAFALTSFARRTGTRHKVLRQIVPHFRQCRQWTGNKARKAQAGPETERADEPTFSQLAKLLDAARSHHISVILVVMPTVRTRTIPPGLPNLAKAKGVHVLDCRQVQDLSREHFRDGVHMSPAGAKFFSPELGRRLVASFPELFGRPAAAPPTRPAP